MREHVTDHTCPWCHARHDRASSAESNYDRRPSDGDAGLCIKCGQWLIFDRSAPDGARQPTPLEAHDLAADATCKRAVRAWRTVARRQKKAAW